MVGVPIGKCENCRKRKKKCGAQKPSCSECIRAGWICPGYKTQWKFVDEAPRLAEQYSRRKYVYDDIDPDAGEALLKYSDEDARLGGIVTRWQNLHYLDGLRHEAHKRHAKSGVPRYHETNPLGSALVYCLDSKEKGTLIPLRVVGSFFEYIPARLGRNAALDNAVSCLCAIYCGIPLTTYSFDRGIYESYARALSSLRLCLSDTSLQMESETLCASILLQMCELVFNGDTGKWSHLARGTAFLLYSRGAHRYTSAFDYAMLESQLGFVLGQSLGFKEHCFLRSPEWRALLLRSPVWPFQTLQSQSLNLRPRLYGTLVDLPSLIIHCSTIDGNQVHSKVWEERSDLSMQRASTMLEDVNRWLKFEAEPLFLSYTSSLQVIQGQINYPDIISGVLDCVANTALLTIDKVLRFLRHAKLQSSSLAERSREQRLEATQHLGGPNNSERWRQRAMKAFKFVQGESILAAKPLGFGLGQAQSSGLPINILSLKTRKSS